MSLRQNQKIKVEDPHVHTSDARPHNDVIIMREVYLELSHKMTYVLDRTRSDSNPDAIKIKSEGVEVCILKFINAFKTNNNIMKRVNMSEIIRSRCFKQHY